VSNVSEENNIFTEFLEDYFAESEEHLTNVQKQLLALENYIGQSEIQATIINQLFRSFHTIKGLSGMVGFQDVENLSHHMESYLKLLRDEKVILTSEGFDLLLQSTKLLEELIMARQRQQDRPDIRKLIEHLTKFIENLTPPKTSQSSITPQQLKLTDQQTENIKNLRQNYQFAWLFSFSPNAKLAEKGINVNVIRSRLESLGKLAHTAPRMTPQNDIVFDFIVLTNSSDEHFLDWQNDGLIWNLYQNFNQQSSEILTEINPVIDDQNLGTEPKISDKIDHNNMINRINRDEIESEVSETNFSQSSPSSSQNANFVRVELTKLDDLMRMLGELVISRAKLDENLKRVQSNLLPLQKRALQEINSTLERQMRDIREGIMRVRLVPIGEVFTRMQFVVRDLVRSSQKDINLEISGQNTEIDKLVVEKMMDPLLHLVRNAVSHGIETPQERRKLNKPSVATVSLSAKTAGEMVIIEIEDDGKGIDRQKVLNKAKKQGLLSQFDQENIDNFTILELLCYPGFSTQEKADRVSGRGVGMTVVKNTVTELGGIVELTTQENKGTRFTVQLPLTLAIADALIIIVKNQRFAIPQSAIREIITITEREITALENNEIMTYRGQVLPIKRLAKIFNLDHENLQDQEQLKVVVIGTQTNAIALIIDQVIGMREIVVRPLTDPLVKVIGIAGATELGDGKVVLILDASALIRTANKIIMDNG